MNKDEINYVVDLALDDIIEQCKVVVDVRELLEEDLIVSSEAGIMNPLDQLKQFFSNLINTIASWLNESIVSGIKGFIDWLWEQISPALSGISSWIEEATKRLQDLGSVFQGFVNAILKFPEWFPSWFEQHIAKPISDALGNLARWIWEHLPDWLKSAITSIKDALDKLAKDPLGTLKSALGYLAQQLWNLLPDWLKNALTGLQKAWDSFVKSAENFFKDPWGNIKSAFESLAKWIWDLLPDWLKGAIQSIQSAWNSFVQGLQDFLKDPAGFISARLQDFAKWIWDNLPEPVKWIIENVKKALEGAWDALVKFFTQDLPGFFSWIWGEIQEFVKDPATYIRERIAKPAWEGLTWAWEQVSAFFGDLATKAISFFQDLGKKLMDALKGAVEWGMGLVKGLIEWLQGATKPLVDVIVNIAKPLLVDAPKEVASKLADYFKKLFTGEGEEGAGELEFLPAIFLAISPFFVTSLLAPRGFKALSHILAELRTRLEGALEPLGLGGKIVVTIMSRINQVLYELGDVMEKVPMKFIEAFGLGTGVVAMLPVRYPMTYAWKSYFRGLGLGDVPFALPPTGETIRLLRRVGIEEARDRVYNIFMYRGYPDWFIENATALPDQLKLEITDRFNTKRIIPLSLLYEQPSISALANFMIRDMFGSGKKAYETFQKWAERLGLYPDVATFYYLLHFRYPPPSRLWSFVVRGISGLLWYEPTNEEMAAVEEDAGAVGAKVPVPPTKLNFKIRDIFAAYRQYLKWMDYANFAWLPGFTSDNWIMMDSVVDLPGRIDIRWMTKWAIFDYMAGKNIGLENPASDFIKVVEGQPANTAVMMDLTMACRLIQATGLHPYYVPVVTVAETMNALADERTLLRTGLLDVYRYGMMSFETLDKLMASLVVATFKVAYVDIKEGKWKEGYINLPVSFLPAERKLLELRALIDRVVRIYREILTEMESGYREYIFEGEEVIKYMEGLVDHLNGYFREESKRIVGKALELKLDATFVEGLLKAWEPARPLYTIRRIRSWVYRVLGWVIYRMAYGWVTEEDAKRVAKTFVEIAKLPAQEAEAVEKILTEMVGIARREVAREYIPTPLSLASMAEHVPEVRRFIDEVLEARNVPEDWRPLWRRYIQIRPLIDEVERVLSAAERLYEYFEIDEASFDKFLQALTPYGWEVAELGLIKDRANLDRWHRAWRELVGTPRELLTMAEYVPRARRLLLAEVKKRIDALPIPEEDKRFLYELWEDYIRIRPVYDEVRREITELINDYANGIITWEQFETLLNELKAWGLDDYEIDAYKFIAMARRARYMARAS